MNQLYELKLVGGISMKGMINIEPKSVYNFRHDLSTNCSPQLVHHAQNPTENSITNPYFTEIEIKHFLYQFSYMKGLLEQNIYVWWNINDC